MKSFLSSGAAAAAQGEKKEENSKRQPEWKKKIRLASLTRYLSRTVRRWTRRLAHSRQVSVRDRPKASNSDEYLSIVEQRVSPTRIVFLADDTRAERERERETTQ